MERTDPAIELLTLAGTYLLALKVIRTLTTTPPIHDIRSQEKQIEEIKEIATATLEHRQPRLSEETLAYLTTQQCLDMQLLNHMVESKLQANGLSHNQASQGFTTEEIAWGCFLTTIEADSLTIHTICHATEKTKALAQSLRLAANSRGNLFSSRRATRILALVNAMGPDERKPYIEQARACLVQYTEQNESASG
jgi:hypothetical protein